MGVGALKRRVVVTGIGVISPVGHSLRDTWEGLTAGRSGIRPISLFDASTFAARIAAEVPGTEWEAGLKPFSALIPYANRGTRLGLAASLQALDDSGLRRSCSGPAVDRVGVCIGTMCDGFPSMEELEACLPSTTEARWDHAKIGAHPPVGNKRFFRRGPHTLPSLIAAAGGLTGPNLTINAACASAALAIGESMRIIQSGEADAMITGGADSMISPLGVGAFIILGALSTSNHEPERASRPFDARRNGFIIGEGACVFVLEAYESAMRRQAPIYGELVGYGSSLNAFRITDSPDDARGAVLAMSSALADAGCGPDEIQYIAAHGTSTVQNDKSEVHAIKKVFGAHAYQLKISSVKSMIGHTISASGAFGLMAALMACKQGVIPPTINLEHPDPDFDLDFVPGRYVHADVHRAMITAFAFGGHNGVLIAQRWEA